MRYISARERNILVDLINPNVSVNLEKLSIRYNCSERTIRRDLLSIESILDDYQLSLLTNQEYLEIVGDFERKKLLLSELPVYEYSQVERILIILDILLRTEDYLKYYVLQNKLQLSQNVLTKDVDFLQEYITQYAGEIERKRSAGLYLHLNERGIRRTIHHFIVEYLKGFNIISLFEGESIQSLINPAMIEYIDSLISADEFTKYIQMIYSSATESKIALNDTSIVQAALYLAIIDKRQGLLEETPERMELEERVVRLLETLQYQEIDKLDFGEFLLNAMRYDLIINYDYKILNIINKFVESFFDATNLPENIEYMFYEDVLTWYHKIIKKQNEFYIDQTQIQELINEFPMLFHILKEQVAIFFEQKISDAELAELLMFLVAHLEEEQRNHELNVLVICIGGMGSSRMIVTRLKNQFPNLNMKNISLAELSHQEKESYDFIISTVSVSINDRDVVKVSPLLFDKDVQEIKRKVREFSVGKTINHVKEKTYSTLITMDQTVQTTVRAMLLDVLSYYEQEYLNTSLDHAIELFLRYQEIGFGIPETEIAVFHIRSVNVKKQLLTFTYSSSPISVRSMMGGMMDASIHIIMLSTDEMTMSEKQLFNTVSILVTRDEKFRNILQDQVLAKIIHYIEAEMK